MSRTVQDRLRDLRDAGVITTRECDLLEQRFVAGLSHRTIAEALDLSRSTVRSIERRAIQKIRVHERSRAA